jgi:2'-5' RNA ligase
MRLFIATNFPSEVLRELNERVAKLRPRLPAASWVREETQHLTFAFLGDQPDALVEQLAAPLADALARVPAFESRLHASGFFPNPRHARVGWIGLEPEARYVEIARVVRGVVEANGVKLDGGDFKPHLTMMRMREGWPPSSIELFTRSLKNYTSAPFTVDAVTLFSSQLNPKGAIHTPLRAFPLAV